MKRTRVTVAVALFVGAAGCGAGGSELPSRDDGTPDAAVVGWTARAELDTLDLRTIWGAGRDLFAAGAGPMIARSDDGGATWQTSSTGLQAGDGFPVFHHLAGSSGTDVWLVGDVSASESVLLHSQDHGKTWQPRVTGGTRDVRGVWALDEKRVLLTTAGGQILRSEDSGASWARVHQEGGVALFGLWGSDDGEIFAAGGVAAMSAGVAAPGDPDERCDGGASASAPGAERGVLLRSMDEGRTWAVAANSPGGILWNVWGTPDGTIVLAAGAHASVALTVDHGATWYADGRAEGSAALDLQDVWVGPRGAYFFASAGGIVRNIRYDCRGPVALSYEEVPAAANGSHGTAAIWGPGSDDVWAVGPGGAIRHRP